ncbi:MAG: GNAT family N-acetyltransferase [Candidatus Dormibacteraeota bacterium]|nr:GNAT family N-acetyltransferase [Candidatus Dormibacteraeota bacterium]
MTGGSRSIRLGVPRMSVWDLLLAPGLREWYYRLTPDAGVEFGAHIRWMDTGGTVAEESDVLEVESPSRLVLRTRFTFAPIFEAAQPHVIKWELGGDEDGCDVRMSWEADEPVSRLLESEADAQLQGLRLAADPAARAELKRLPQIGPVEVRDVTPDLLPAYLDFFDHRAFRDYPPWQSCYCMETHRTEDEDEWAQRTAGDNRRDMSESIKRGLVTGLLAFEGGQPIGWCNYGETTRLSGLMHKMGLAASGHEGVGSVACFVIAAPYRGHGVASALLDAAVERLRARGLRAIEAYPKRSDDSQRTNYRGPLAMFIRAGFEPYREAGNHLILRKSLA